ncbi:hypothetical protein R3P38DRAFT_3251741 [Favolaschia claudopus]|uniref:F-box protein n=1 Tax=Favolaschia claudopus TaxID=2862362 RepID=A0AAW0EDG0_9AGAR
MAACYAALAIRELVDQICDEIMSHPSPLHPCFSRPKDFLASPSARSTCAALARSGKIFTESASCALWKRQNCLEPFLRLFPSDLLRPPTTSDAQKAAGDTTVWKLLRPLNTTDFARPSIYAFRVRELFFDSPAWEPVSHAISIISMCSPGSFLLPRLRVLTIISPHEPPEVTTLRTFFPPTLKRVNLSWKATIATTSILAVLGELCPDLTDVHIFFLADADDALAGATVSHAVCTLHHLVSVSICAPLVKAVLHLGQLSTLTTLSLRALSFAIHPIPSTSCSLFRFLRDLTLSNMGIEQATAFLLLCCSSPLSSFRTPLLHYSDASTPAQVEALYDALVVACAPGSLQTLELQLNGVAIAAQPMTMDKSMLSKLTRFSNLTTLIISGPFAFDLNDDDVFELVVAWPSMTHLDFSPDYACDIPPSVTLQSLQTLAERCTQLSSLSLNLDATAIPSPPPRRIVNHSLSDISVCSSSNISDPVAVARFLAGLCPNLDTIWTAIDNTEEVEDDWDAVAIERHERWKQVERLLPASLWVGL